MDETRVREVVGEMLTAWVGNARVCVYPTGSREIEDLITIERRDDGDRWTEIWRSDLPCQFPPRR
jgi:hypothetical protein